MPKQRYRLQALLTLRDRMKKKAEYALARALKALQDAKDRLKELEKEKEKILEEQEKARAEMTGRMNAAAMVGEGNVYVNFLRKLKDDEKDKEEYEISTKDFLGKCVMTPGIMKDTYRLATWLGRDCDAGCQISMATGINLPTGGTGFSRHLAILTTARNGLIEGSLNDNSVSQLRKAAEAEPNNGIYQAAYNRFYKGNQSDTWKALNNETLFPKNNAATGKNYCTEYLWQRDETRKEDLVVKEGCVQFFDPKTKVSIKECDLKNSDDTPIKDGEVLSRLVYNKDWLPCSKNHPKPMAEWLFAWALATGEI